MSKARAQKGDDAIHEIIEIDPTRIDAVSRPANRAGAFLLVKSVAPMSPKARAAFAENAEAVRRGERPRKAKRSGRLVRDRDGVVTVPGPDRLARERAKAVARASRARRAAGASSKRAAKAARRMAGSPEIPVTNVRDEAASIMSAVTGEHTNKLCNARTVNGTPCRRPAVRNNGRCHFHM